MSIQPRWATNKWRPKTPPPVFTTITPSPGPIGVGPYGALGTVGIAGIVKDYRNEKEEALKIQIEKNRMMGIAYKVLLFKGLQPIVVPHSAQPEVEEGLYDSESCEVDNEF